MAHKKVIIAEDEMVAAIGLQHLLEDQGFTILKIVDTGRELINCTIKYKPDIIFVDIFLKNHENLKVFPHLLLQ